VSGQAKRRDSAQTFVYGAAATFLAILLVLFLVGVLTSDDLVAYVKNFFNRP
jgi:hypothetical protein